MPFSVHHPPHARQLRTTCAASCVISRSCSSTSFTRPSWARRIRARRPSTRLCGCILAGCGPRWTAAAPQARRRFLRPRGDARNPTCRGRAVRRRREARGVREPDAGDEPCRQRGLSRRRNQLQDAEVAQALDVLAAHHQAQGAVCVSVRGTGRKCAAAIAPNRARFASLTHTARALRAAAHKKVKRAHSASTNKQMYPRRLITGGTSKTATEQALAAAARSECAPSMQGGVFRTAAAAAAAAAAGD